MSDNLEVAKECGFLVAAEAKNGPVLTGHTGAFEAYTSRILASQQAAHDAEIAMHERNCVEFIRLEADAREQLSTANERNTHLEGLVALQADALKEAINGLRDVDARKAIRLANNALSASAETVQAFRDKLTEPLRREVASLHHALTLAIGAIGMMQPCADERCKLEQQEWKDIAEQKAKAALNDTQATAQAYEQEVEARGAVKALEEAQGLFIKWYVSERELRLVCASIEKRDELTRLMIGATSKKAG